ncbi:MAG: ABC transporter [Gammaproteobacteria bacterium]|nr:MAG: ABC transporter [Gammaproteobacteria bacterium]
MEKLTPERRSPWQVLNDVVAALFVRELKTRFGSSKLGYFWMLAEPAAMVLVFSAMYTLLGRRVLVGVDVPLFLLTGILPYLLFTKLISSLTSAVKSNKALFVYSQVTPIAPIITRFLIEVAVYSLTYVSLLLIMAWAGFQALPADPLGFIVVNCLVMSLGAGFGLVLCSAQERWQDAEKLASIIMRPLFLLSGVLYVMSMIPQQYWYLLKWNPLLHLNELARSVFFQSYSSQFASWEYPLLLALFLNMLGLMLFRVNRDKFIAS